MKRELYYCDICKKEINDMELVKEDIPVIEEIWAKGGRGNIKLFPLGSSLEFKEIDFCCKCRENYKKIWTNGMVLIAQKWQEQVDLMKDESQ